MNRRRFVGLAAKLSAVVATFRAQPGWSASPAASSESPSALQAAVDEIVPAADPFPSASGAGALAYLERRRGEDAAFAKALDGALAALDRLCRETSGLAFDAATREQRVAALRSLETAEPPLFAELRDATYEAYYTRPEVTRLLGFDFRTGSEPTAKLEPFDASRLDRVRRLAPFHREAGE